MILVTGATGTIGSRLVQLLTGQGVPFRVGARAPDKARKLLGASQAEVVAFEWTEPRTFTDALRGADHLFLLTPFLPNQVELGARLVDAAREAGVQHVVKLSSFGCEHEPGIQLGRWHRELELHVERSGMGWTHLRPNNFMENLIAFMREPIRREGKIYQPLGDGAVSVIAAGDIAEVAARVLCDAGHMGRAYTLTGPEALTVRQQADTLGRLLGKPVTYVDVPEAAVRQSMAGAPPWMVDAMMELNALDKAGHAAAVTPDVERVLGRKPASFGAWAERNAPAFR